MILEKETFKKFGYWPKDLGSNSFKKILCKCKKCNLIRETTKSSINRNLNYGTGRSSEMCLKCSSSTTATTRIKKQRQNARRKLTLLWKNTKPLKIDAKLAIFLWKSTGLGNLNVVKRGGKILPYIKNHSKKGEGPWKALDQEKSVAVLKGLGFNEQVFDLTEYKDGILNYIKKLSTADKFAIVNELVSNSISKRGKTFISINLSYEKWNEILALIPIEFKADGSCRMSKNGFPANRIVITKGSFFIDGRWVHVG